MKMRSFLFQLSFLAFFYATEAQAPRMTLDFNRGWEFYLSTDSAGVMPLASDTGWNQVQLPHDWSIEHDFSNRWPATNQGGALPGGIGWYKKAFVLPANPTGKKVSIEFDGIYRNSEVWINGHSIGKRPNGYISFSYDLTPYLKAAPAVNELMVKADNSNLPDSRWYTGSGIYRDVRLVVKSEVAVAWQGVVVTTQPIDTRTEEITINGRLDLDPSDLPEILGITVNIYNEEGKKVHSGTEAIRVRSFYKGKTDAFSEVIRLANPVRWSTMRPALYRAEVRITVNDKESDVYTTRFGIRQFRFDPVKGLFVNNETVRIKGVCMHHDLGALGAAFNRSAAQRQLRILKEMGCNAIRTAHNPPAPGFLDLCDEMGFLVMDEAFDMWRSKKNKYDYHLDFKEWHQRDLEDMIIRDRNHPSVFLWSIGNEIREQFDSSGQEIARELVAIVKALDTTRPVTCALTENMPEKNHIYRSGALDVLGFNYKLNDYDKLQQRFPGQWIVATETASALSTRGVYDQPGDSLRIWPPDAKPFKGGNADKSVAAYDNTFAYWGATHEQALLAVNRHPYLAGCFVWSGFDFIGEPVPYPWPARSAYYGIVDLAGFPKDVYYMYQSEWTEKPVLHLLPHWNWKSGDTIDVWAYYNQADEVELFLNGRSLGKASKGNDRLHASWKVAYRAGTLRAVSRKNNKTVLVKEIRTAGKPAQIRLSAEKTTAKAGSDKRWFVTARITDAQGNLVPDASLPVRFSVSGGARIAGTDNGFQADSVSLKRPVRNAWKGQVLAILIPSEKKGNSTLKAEAQGLLPAVLTLKTNE